MSWMHHWLAYWLTPRLPVWTWDCEEQFWRYSTSFPHQNTVIFFLPFTPPIGKNTLVFHIIFLKSNPIFLSLKSTSWAYHWHKIILPLIFQICCCVLKLQDSTIFDLVLSCVEVHRGSVVLQMTLHQMSCSQSWQQGQLCCKHSTTHDSGQLASMLTCLIWTWPLNTQHLQQNNPGPDSWVVIENRQLKLTKYR